MNLKVRDTKSEKTIYSEMEVLKSPLKQNQLPVLKVKKSFHIGTNCSIKVLCVLSIAENLYLHLFQLDWNSRLILGPDLAGLLDYV